MPIRRLRCPAFSTLSAPTPFEWGLLCCWLYINAYTRKGERSGSLRLIQKKKAGIWSWALDLCIQNCPESAPQKWSFFLVTPVLCCWWHSLPGCLFLSPPRGAISRCSEAPACIFQRGAAWMHGSIWFPMWVVMIGLIGRSFMDYGALEFSENRFVGWKRTLLVLQAERKNIWHSHFKMNLNNGDLPFVFSLVPLSWTGNSGHRWQNICAGYGDNNPDNVFFSSHPFLWAEAAEGLSVVVLLCYDRSNEQQQLLLLLQDKGPQQFP